MVDMLFHYKFALVRDYGGSNDWPRVIGFVKVGGENFEEIAEWINNAWLVFLHSELRENDDEFDFNTENNFTAFLESRGKEENRPVEVEIVQEQWSQIVLRDEL